MSQLHVLIAEDDADARDLLGELLTLWGYRVSTAETGPLAVQVALTEKIDLALIDIGLPTLDGYAVARAIRDAESSTNSPRRYLVALTGYGEAQDRERAREAGFDEHRTKPVEPDALRSLLESVDAGRPIASL